MFDINKFFSTPDTQTSFNYTNGNVTGRVVVKGACSDWSSEAMAEMISAGSGVNQLHLGGETLSGRPFKYELTEYHIRPEMTPEAALELARRIVKEKYRESEWDRRHRHVDAERELVFAFTNFILWVIGTLAGTEPVKAKWISDWGIYFDAQLDEKFSENNRAAAEQRLQELISRDGNRYTLKPLPKIFLDKAEN
jgi:hypothetical protein